MTAMPRRPSHHLTQFHPGPLHARRRGPALGPREPRRRKGLPRYLLPEYLHGPKSPPDSLRPSTGPPTGTKMEPSRRVAFERIAYPSAAEPPFPRACASRSLKPPLTSLRGQDLRSTRELTSGVHSTVRLRPSAPMELLNSERKPHRRSTAARSTPPRPTLPSTSQCNGFAKHAP